MRVAFGALKWTPDIFWSATLSEFVQAIEGLNEANGVKKKVGAPSDAEMEKLLERYG